MSQFDILRMIVLRFFNDTDLKDAMGIPAANRNNIAMFRDKYCISSVNTGVVTFNDVVCRLAISWDASMEIGHPFVLRRPLRIEIFIQKKEQYTYGDNVLIRRQDIITKHIKRLLSTTVEGYRFFCTNEEDLYSGSPEYDRGCIIFKVKNLV